MRKQCTPREVWEERETHGVLFEYIREDFFRAFMPGRHEPNGDGGRREPQIGRIPKGRPLDGPDI